MNFKKNTLSTIVKTFKLVIDNKLYNFIVIHIIILLLHTILTTYQMSLQKNMVDTISAVQSVGIKPALRLIVLYFILLNLLNVLWTARFLCTVSFGPKFDKLFRCKIIDKINKLNLIYFEDSELFNLIEKAKKASYYAIRSFTTGYQMILSHLGTVIGITIFLSSVKPIFLVIIFFSAIPKIISSKYKGHKKLYLEDQLAPLRRELSYYSDCITDRRHFKETRLLGAWSYFIRLHTKTLDSINRFEWNNIMKLSKMEILIKIIDWLSYLATFGLASFYLYSGEITLGAFTMVLTSLSILDGRIGNIIHNIGLILEESPLGANLFTFLELDEKNDRYNKAILNKVESINFEDVTFKYPSKDENAISNISLEISQGETIAIIGLNGAGKTTFVKLLLGLLVPTFGKVKYNGLDISTICEERLFSGSSALLQTFGQYKLSIRENVAISDSDNIHLESRINECLDFTGFSLNDQKFPNGLDTKLGKEFGGTDISGGQWQLLGIARAIFKENNLFVLDEPTSAIDPLKEDELFNKFSEICKDKTSVIITHRMGIAKIADRILVFENGKIMEDGSHDELIANKNLYYDLYKEQSSWYERTSTI